MKTSGWKRQRSYFTPSRSDGMILSLVLNRGMNPRATLILSLRDVLKKMQKPKGTALISSVMPVPNRYPAFLSGIPWGQRLVKDGFEEAAALGL